MGISHRRFAVLRVWAFLLQVSMGLARANDGPLVRETQAVMVNGAEETWRLIWERPPRPVCGADEIEMATTCPCNGFAYGEAGKLRLVRYSSGTVKGSMELQELFIGHETPATEVGLGDLAVVQRRARETGDLARADPDDPALQEEIARRPSVQLMRFADYSRSGSATQFLLRLENLPCGKGQFSAIGVTPQDGRLHALRSVAHPERILVMPLQAWRALRSSPGPTVVQTWACGDHGSEQRTELVVAATNGLISVTSRRYSCPKDGSAEQVIDESEE